MKAAIILSLAAVASAIVNCQIPARYVTLTGTACNAPNPAYNIWGVCVHGLPQGAADAFTLTNGARVQFAADGSNSDAFTAANAGNAEGCSVPNPISDWGGADGTTTTTAAITDDDNACTASAGAGQLFAIGESIVKGVEIWCAPNFFVTNGFGGTNVCLPRNGNQWNAGIPDAAATQVNDFWATPTFYQALNGDATQFVTAQIPQFSGDNALRCNAACTLPSNICNAGVGVNQQLRGFGNGFDANTCLLQPTNANQNAAYFGFACASGITAAPEFRITCTGAVDATTSTSNAATVYNSQCGAADGAQSPYFWNNNGNFDGWANPITLESGSIVNFNNIGGTLGPAYNVALSGYASPNLRYWNNNPVQQLQAATVYQIIVTGCDAQTTVDLRTQCVQQTLNWWGCHYGFPYNGGTTCYSNNRIIACPTHELGFRCETSSKKGLLGLLGLLGIIPCLLLLCCSLLLCCIRRKKTEGDVHFATFDPHAAPVVAPTAAPIATTAAFPVDCGFGAAPMGAPMTGYPTAL